MRKPKQRFQIIPLRLIGGATIHKLTIEELEVGTLRVRDLEVENR